ncbi:hypothetical protein TL16_g12347 [Triparma laevis f. inornata]|uniref:Response regulatory domain-containing protein n=1 Tax=Triparma laevis f. inornata TaxID=1714386 RepID=A0A9W7EVT6_9STRA|nr:hypothetical protein TL16_g12347 [Triparma laevis f. inornata]
MSTPDASLRVAGELDEEDADMFTYFESKLVQAEEQQAGEGGREVGGKGSNVVETGKEEYNYSSLNLLNLLDLLNLQNDRPTFRNNIMESEFLKSNAKTSVERDYESSFIVIICAFLLYFVHFNTMHFPLDMEQSIIDFGNYNGLSAWVAADQFLNFMQEQYTSYRIYHYVIAFFPTSFVLSLTIAYVLYTSSSTNSSHFISRDKIYLLAVLTMTTLFLCMYAFSMEMAVIFRSNHCVHQKIDHYQNAVNLDTNMGTAFFLTVLTPDGFSTIRAPHNCLINVYRGIMVSTVTCFAFYITFLTLVVQRYYHAQISYLFTYFLIFFLFQGHVQGSIIASLDSSVRQNLDTLVSHNQFTGFILTVAVMYKDYVDNCFARAKWGEERWNVWKTNVSVTNQRARYKVLQHKIQNAVIEVEGIIAELLTNFIEVQKGVLSTKEGKEKEFSQMSPSEQITYDMENILQKAIKIKRNIHSHDIIRQIGDKTYQVKRSYESTSDIVSLLTEGEGSQVKVEIGENCSKNNKTQVQKFLIDSDALSFVFADAIRNARKYSPPGHIPTISIDYQEEVGFLVICCMNKTNPSRHKTLTDDEIARIFAREAKLAQRGFVSSNLGLPAAYAAASFLPGYDLEFFEDKDKIVKFKVSLKAPSKFFDIEQKLPDNLIGLACDDSLVSRKTVKMFMDRKLELSDQSYILGETREEVLKCVDYALGKEAGFNKADIVIMDQNLDFEGSEMLYGTHIASELHKKGFSGIVVIMSANSSRMEEEIYMKVPGVDCVCGKHLTINHRNNRIVEAWFKKQEANKKKETKKILGGVRGMGTENWNGN